ncbi:MAG: type IV toxin-antitoxin system AbiEi family antitoxin [Thermodesulfobacteriota bacterium]|nr:type IV toxin-antitoxin system AbiEi family antitoxin [Thermodesulfobacteriota bacterium]
MSQPTLRETKIIRAIITALNKRPGLDAKFIPGDTLSPPSPLSGYLCLLGDWGSIQLPVYIAWRITPQQAKLLVFQLQALHEQQPLLLADYVPESLASQLHLHQLSYLDTVGNGSICTPPLFYEVSGRRKKGVKLLPNRSQQGAGSKIIYQLLNDPQLCNQPYRTIATRSQVALGAVGPVIKELQTKQLLLDDVHGQRHISKHTALRQLWEAAYLGSLRPKLQVERCTMSTPWSFDDFPFLIRKQKLEDQVLIGGELAASFFCENIRPLSATLHLAKNAALKQMIQLHLTPCADGSITIIHQFADNNAFKQRSPEGLQLADPLLVRCELLYSEKPELIPIAAALEQLYLHSEE